MDRLHVKHTLKTTNWKLFGLITVFGISSWLTINGVFVELPSLAASQPEKWKIGSYLSVVVQLANILGNLSRSVLDRNLTFNLPALLYFFAATRWRIHENVAIYVLLGIGIVVCFLLSNFYSGTSMIGGTEHSTALFILAFIGGSVDCISSIVYWPFIAQYRAIYSSALTAGEGLSGASASFLGLVQDQNGKHNNFSPQIFFLMLGILMILSTLAFTIIIFRKVGEYEKEDIHQLRHSSPYVQVLESDYESEQFQQPLLRRIWWPLLIQFGINFVENGAIPSLATYAFLHYPEGHHVMSISINTSLILDPLVCVLGGFVQFYYLGFLSIGWIAGTCYYILIACLGGSAPLVDYHAGAWVMFTVFVLTRCLLAYTKTMVYYVLKEMLAQSYEIDTETVKAYRWAGITTQVGSGIGSVVFFALVNYSHIF